MLLASWEGRGIGLGVKKLPGAECTGEHGKIHKNQSFPLIIVELGHGKAERNISCLPGKGGLQA